MINFLIIALKSQLNYSILSGYISYKNKKVIQEKKQGVKSEYIDDLYFKYLYIC